MKFCKFFPLAVLSSVLSCYCSADYISRSVGAGPSSTVYSYISGSDQNTSDKICSLRVIPYRPVAFRVVPNVYVLDDIQCCSFDDRYISSFLLNVIDNVVKKDNSEEKIKFLVYIPGLKDQDIIPVLNTFGFSKDDDVYCDSIYRDYSADENGYLRLFVSKDSLGDLLNKVNNKYGVNLLEIKDI